MSIASTEQIEEAKKNEALEREIIKVIAKREKISFKEAERKYWILKVQNEMRLKEQGEAKKRFRSNLLYYTAIISIIIILYFLFR